MRKTVKAKGNAFFSFTDSLIYQPKGAVFGQSTKQSCVAAVCRMILQDNRIEVLEYHLRNDLRIDEDGASLADIPDVLRKNGLRKKYEYARDLTLADLQKYTLKASALVSLRKKEQIIGHALLVDGFEEIEGEFYVLIRDPLPLMLGTAYKIKAEIFWLFWKRFNPAKNADFGNAIVVK